MCFVCVCFCLCVCVCFSRAITLWRFWTSALRPRGWTQRWGQQSGWDSLRVTGFTPSTTASRVWPKARWETHTHTHVWSLSELGFIWWTDTDLFLQLTEVHWHDVAGWTGQGGSLLGTKRSVRCVIRHQISSFLFIQEDVCVLITHNSNEWHAAWFLCLLCQATPTIWFHWSNLLPISEY